MMNPPIFEQVQRSRLSSARRTFILIELLQRAQALGMQELVKEIDRVLDFEVRSMEERFIAARHHSMGLGGLSESSDVEQVDGERAFLSLIMSIESLSTPTTRELLLTPVIQQLERLDYFASLDEVVEIRQI